MKPKVFIGSSTEGLDIAYSIQQNLEHDAECTVWTQGVFRLSTNILDALLKSLEDFDFGIFVFKPDDLLEMRDNKYSVVRDNVIFELGLFIGRLGKEKVFFVLPDNSENFHLPTDLLGVLAGKYSDRREDKNVLAALGPFCHQVRLIFKEFAYANVDGLENECKEAKKIAIDKKGFWEAHLFASLLKSKMKDVTLTSKDVRSGRIFRKVVAVEIKDLPRWIRQSTANLLRLIEVSKNIFPGEVNEAFGPPGESGDIGKIKAVVNKVTAVCNEALNWELDLQAAEMPDEFKEAQKIMETWSDSIVNAFNGLPTLLEQAFSEENIAYHEANNQAIEVAITFEEPQNANRVNEIIDDIGNRVENGMISV